MVKTKTLAVVFITFLLFGFMGNAWSAESAGKIDINSASIEQFTTLKGIGPSLAQRIIEYRQANGNFKSVDGLKQVKGIGDKTLADIENDITVAAAEETKE